MDQIFHEYQLVTALARKTASTLYLAQSITDPSEKVIIKFFHALDSNFGQERFQNEISQISQLRHSFIIPLLEAGIDEERPYLISAYASGNSLRHRMMAFSPDPLPFDKAVATLVRVGQALAYAHTQNIVHANIKPENIFFNTQEEALLADFTPLSLIETYSSPSRIDLLHVHSVPPEQFEGIYSKQSDQYALGYLAYELLTGQSPFPPGDSTAEETSKSPIPLTHIVPELPQHIDVAVLKALAKDPLERHESIQAFLEALTASFWDRIMTTFPVEIMSSSTGNVSQTPSMSFDGESLASTESEITTKRPALGRTPTPSPSQSRKRVAIGVGAALVLACFLLLGMGVLPRLLFSSDVSKQSYQQEIPTSSAGSATKTAVQVTPTLQSSPQSTATATQVIPSPTVGDGATQAMVSPTVAPSPTLAPSPPSKPKPTPSPTSVPTPTPTPNCQCLLLCSC